MSRLADLILVALLAMFLSGCDTVSFADDQSPRLGKHNASVSFKF